MFKEITIYDQQLPLKGHVMKPSQPVKAWIIFSHGSGSSRKSQRNNWVAHELNEKGFGTLLFDLLTIEEDNDDLNRFNIPLLARRLMKATYWLQNDQEYDQSGALFINACLYGQKNLMGSGSGSRASKHRP